MLIYNFHGCCGAGTMYGFYYDQKDAFIVDLRASEAVARHKNQYGLVTAIISGSQDAYGVGAWMEEEGWTRCNEAPINNPVHHSSGLILFWKDINEVPKENYKPFEGRF